ncbi:L,D-transpeptidase family protein [Pedobacter aquatilis]|uniref:L,D-transpeptidase family protein n=1 Tax=Pedobacter aquatilis TaxID=351343 RepID=UPI0025B46E09|nr:L,D-transpeptidase family protein [Pedobacter aquatilis]MDN3588383.1 L,D-transpeptidase family protein [Pedobacter aquatilis]
MRYLSLIVPLFIVIFIVLWRYNKTESKVNRVDEEGNFKNFGIQWADSLMQRLPANLDTSIIVSDANEKPLQFYQYIKPVFNGEATIYLENGRWRLQRFTKIALDSLERDDFAIARADRYSAYRNPDSSTTYQQKFINIANRLNMADYILVIKHQRKMYVKRKGINILEFDINLGGKPVGNKQYEGDRKTPEGIYHLDVKFNRTDKFYKSFMISYPNSVDKERAARKGVKPGSGILIHGTSLNRRNAKDWTNGCIALKNKEMDSLFNHVLDGTKIEIRK